MDSNQLITQWLKQNLGFESIQLVTQAALKGIDSESSHDSSGSPSIDSDRLMARAASLVIKSNWLMTQNASPLFDSNPLMTQAKNIWFWVSSWFDCQSYPCLGWAAPLHLNLPLPGHSAERIRLKGVACSVSPHWLSPEPIAVFGTTRLCLNRINTPYENFEST